jgi:hypothetical protein
MWDGATKLSSLSNGSTVQKRTVFRVEIDGIPRDIGSWNLQVYRGSNAALRDVLDSEQLETDGIKRDMGS